MRSKAISISLIVLSLLAVSALSVPVSTVSAAVLNPTSDPYGAYATGSDGPNFNENGGAGSLGASADFTADGAQHGDASANLHFAEVSATVGPQFSTAAAIADFYDTYTIHSSTLPKGTPAHIVITYFVEGTITEGGVCCVDLADGGHGSLSYEVLTGAPGQSPLDRETLNFTQAWSSGCSCPYPPTATLDTGIQAIDKDLSVGDSIVVEIELTCALGTAGAGASCSESDPVSVASTTSGVTIISAAEQAATTPALGTLLSQTTIAQGSSVSDTATLGGGTNPTGTMKFFVSTTDACPSVNGIQIGGASVVSGNGDYSSSSQTFNTPGTFYWYAVYSGNGGNNAVTSTCESLVVTPTTTSTTTTTTTTTTAYGVPEYSTPLAITVAITFLALTIVLRTRKLTDL